MTCAGIQYKGHRNSGNDHSKYTGKNEAPMFKDPLTKTKILTHEDRAPSGLLITNFRR